jgi:D-glycerate 3-kinase
LPAGYADVCERWWRPLAGQIAARGRGTVVGINGAQGSGKSTLCRALEVFLHEDAGRRAVTMSIDDLYRTRAERRALGRDVHPLFTTRGVPGTHDVELGLRTIESLLHGTGCVSVPRFDKARDDRVGHESWPSVAAPVDVVLFEGWCVGLGPQDPAALHPPINALEHGHDADGLWRTTVNHALATDYRALFAQIDMLVFLKIGEFARIREWRMLQEEKLIARAGGGMTRDAINSFLEHYERLTRHALETLPARADVVFEIGDDHNPCAVTVRVAEFSDKNRAPDHFGSGKLVGTTGFEPATPTPPV